MARSPDTIRATLIGDIVGSRQAADRAATHRALRAAVDAANEQVSATSPLRITAGDEFQGAYASLGAAVDVALRLRLSLADQVDLRFGLGWGPTRALAADGIEDGPGWWAARAAIETVAELQGKAASRGLRTHVAIAPESPRPDSPAIIAALHCQDHLVSLCDTRSRRVLRGLMDGTTQSAIAEAEGVSAQAISSRVARDGLWVIADAAAELAQLP